jgi:hypothetical protein
LEIGLSDFGGSDFLGKKKVPWRALSLIKSQFTIKKTFFKN